MSTASVAAPPARPQAPEPAPACGPGRPGADPDVPGPAAGGGGAARPARDPVTALRGYFRLYETWEGDLDGSLQTLHGESLWGAPGLLGPYLGQITSRQMALAYLQEQLERDFQEIEEAAARRLVTGRQAG